MTAGNLLIKQATTTFSSFHETERRDIQEDGILRVNSRSPV
jgi:hypothetical protein